MPDIGIFGTHDPLSEKTLQPYAYAYNNPIFFTDPTGMEGESTHTDKYGKVIAVINDGDTSVYKHDDNADGRAPTDNQIAKRQEKSGTSAGGQKMGETEFWDEFLAPGAKAGEDKFGGAVIHFGESWDKDLSDLHKDAMNYNLLKIGAKSHEFQDYDLKNKTKYASDGVMTGKLLAGKYTSARSAGNYLAGWNGREATLMGVHLTLYQYMNLAGSLQQNQYEGFKTARDIIFNGKTFGKYPYYGEEPYSGRMIIKGFNNNIKK